jgi:sodium/potassium/calcium exchanger 6
VANFIVAKEGKPMTGFSASYGSPLLNVLLGVGIGSLAAIALRGGSYKVKLTTQLTVAIASLLFSLVASILLVILLKFTAHRLLGVLLVTSYIVFFVVLMAVEFS